MCYTYEVKEKKTQKAKVKEKLAEIPA
jgi:hypothetical protein